MNKALARSVACAVVVAALVLAPAHAWASEWSSKKGDLMEIFYRAEVDLKKFDRKVKVRWLKGGKRLRGISGLSLAGAVVFKLDVIRMNVERILDMYPRQWLVGLHVIKDKAGVREIMRKRFRKDAGHLAFYSRGDKNIYVAANRANENIVAHEIAHAIIDQKLGSAVPSTVHEILARYVDAHLYD